MKLVKVFSNKNFKNVQFNEHFNVVLATITDTINKKDTHNLGKTSLVHVINFLLLSKFENGKGLLGNKIFAEQIFYLEISLNSGKYLVIKRAIDAPTKISFKLNDTQLTDFTAPSTWTEEDLPFEKAKEKLNEYLEFDVLQNWPYRQSITYFLRTQQDYLDVYQLSKFKGKHIDWKPFVFELLGFNGNIIKKKLLLEEEANEKKSAIDTLQREANVDINERDRILGLIDIKTSEKKEAEQTIDKFNFYLQDNAINKDLIDELDTQIQTLSSERYRIGYDISKNEESLRKSASDIDVKKLKDLYQEVQLYFPNQLQKQYEELEGFNKAISTERQKYLAENLENLKSEYSEINARIKSLERDKSEKLSFLTEKDTYTKFKEYQKDLAATEADLRQLKDKLQLIDKSVAIEIQCKEIDEQIKESISEIKKAIDLRKHAEINKIFNQIITDIVGTNAIISIKQNKQGNIEFLADYQQQNNSISTSEAEGTSYKKLLCMAFDLALLIHYRNNSFYRFVYHDGILEALDDRIKLRLLDKTKALCEQYNIQCIVSAIDSDIPRYPDNTLYPIADNEVCLRLDDLNDEGKLFKQSF